MAKLIQIHPKDTVAVALAPIPEGTAFMGIIAAENIPQGHKMALAEMPRDAKVIKYGCAIGHATEHICPGQWVHSHNMATDLSGEEEYTYQPKECALPSSPAGHFLGYRRPDGRVGIRNEIWIIPTVGCVNDVAKTLAAENQHLAQGNVEGVYAFPHPYGCSQTGDDHAQTRRLLAALARHPNAGAVLIVGLGCENLTMTQFREELGAFEDGRVQFMICQQEEDELKAGSALLRTCAAYAGRFSRTEIPASELVVGMKCGGSDGLSGITANPVVGRFSDMLISQGGSTILTEVPEMFGAESMLLDRCENVQVFEAVCQMLNGFKQYFIRHGEEVYENPSPGNREGGITTLEDKSCGCVQKGGSAPIRDVIGYAQQQRKRGLTLLNGPGNDLVSATALAAAGAHLVLFTTGRGTPFGAPVPTMKLATNTHLAQKKANWIDFNTGMVADGEVTMESCARDLMALVLQIASGKQTCSEQKNYREIAIFKDGVTL